MSWPGAAGAVPPRFGSLCACRRRRPAGSTHRGAARRWSGADDRRTAGGVGAAGELRPARGLSGSRRSAPGTHDLSACGKAPGQPCSDGNGRRPRADLRQQTLGRPVRDGPLREPETWRFRRALGFEGIAASTAVSAAEPVAGSMLAPAPTSP